jgi:hypothetical protein
MVGIGTKLLTHLEQEEKAWMSPAWGKQSEKYKDSIVYSNSLAAR